MNSDSNDLAYTSSLFIELLTEIINSFIGNLSNKTFVILSFLMFGIIGSINHFLGFKS